MRMELLETLYKQKLAELLDAEQQLLRFLPQMSKAIRHPQLREFLDQHAEQTKSHCQRLEQLIARRGVDEKRKSKAMTGILSESKELLKQQASSDPHVLTLALISAAQDVEGHEITSYACAHTYARLLGFHEDLKLLEETFEEEKNMEEKLVTLAEILGLEDAENETPLEVAHQKGA